MKKSQRQLLIKQLLHTYQVETQEELLALLKKEGVDATQATISRDIRELNIVKSHNEDGNVHYIVYNPAVGSSEEKLKSACKDSVTRVVRVQFMTIIHTLLSSADVVAALLDDIQYDEVVGTLAGTDTIVCISHDEEEAQQFADRIKNFML